MLEVPAVAALTILVLALFVGWEIINKVPPTLHTPLMSGSNAISGITIVGAAIVTLILLWLIDKTIGLRLKQQDEHAGMDHSLHGEHGYGMLNPN